MKPAGSLPHSQDPYICSYSEPLESTTIRPVSLKINFYIILDSMPEYSKWSSSFRYPSQNPVFISFLLHMPHDQHISRSLIPSPNSGEVQV